MPVLDAIRERTRRLGAGALVGVVAAGVALATAPAALAEVTVVDQAIVRYPGGTAALRPLTGSEQTPLGGITGPLRVVADDGSSACEAADLAGLDVTGAVVLVRRGGCDEATKERNAAAAGAVAVVIANSVGGPYDAASAGTVAAGTAGAADGDALATRAGQPVTFELRYHVNRPPTATDDTYRTPAGQPLTVEAPGPVGTDGDADADDRPTAVPQSTTNATGTFDLRADGSFTYLPARGYTGTAVFPYRVTDGRETSAPANVSIAVEAPATPVPARADLAASLGVPASARPGTSVAVTLTVRNAGPSAAAGVATGITVPAGMTVTNGGGGAVAGGKRVVGFLAPTIAPGASVTYRVTVAIASSTRGTQSISGGVVSVRTQDTHYADNVARRTITVR